MQSQRYAAPPPPVVTELRAVAAAAGHQQRSKHCGLMLGQTLDGHGAHREADDDHGSRAGGIRLVQCRHGRGPSGVQVSHGGGIPLGAALEDGPAEEVRRNDPKAERAHPVGEVEDGWAQAEGRVRDEDGGHGRDASGPD